MNVRHILSEMQTLESGLTAHARCAFPHAVHTLGITNWMQCLVWRNVSPQIDSGAWRHFARAVTPTCRLSLCHGSFASSATAYLCTDAAGALCMQTPRRPLLRRNTWSRETRRISLSEPRCHGRGFFYSSARLQ